MGQDFSKLPSLQDSAAMSREDFDKAHGRWIDNPGPEWLASKMQSGESPARTSGFNTPVNMPTSWLMGIKGAKGEHNRLTSAHPEVQSLAREIREDGGLKEPPHVVFHHKDEPSVYNGNHRIRAQYLNGEESTPVQLDMQNGAEEFFHPHDVIKAHVDKQNRDKKIQDLLDRHKNLSSNRTAAKVDKLEPVKREQAKDEEWLWQHPGRPTARVDKLVSLPVAWLKTLPGLRGEHKKLTKDMPKVKALAELVKDRSWQRENPITLGVQHDGKVYIDDGNHRVLGAQISKLDTLLCKVKYYGGGENKLDLNKIIDKYADQISDIILKTAADYSKNRGYYPKGKTNRCFGAGLGNEGCKGVATGGGLFCDPCKNNPNRKKRDPEAPAPSPSSMYVDKHTQNQIWNADPRNKKASPDILNAITQLTNSGVDWGKVMEQAVVNKPLISGTVNQIKAKIPKIKSPKEEQEFANKSVSASLIKWADDQGISGATDLDGGPGDQEFDEAATRGADYAGANDPNKGDEPILNKSHPNEDEDKPQNDIKTAAVEPYYEWNHNKVPHGAETLPLESVYPGKSPMPMSPETQMKYIKPTSNDEVINTLDTPGPEMTERRPSQGKVGPDDDVELLDPHLPVNKQYVKNEFPEGMHSEPKIEPRIKPNDFTKVKRMYDNHVGTEGLPFSLNNLKEIARIAKKITENFDSLVDNRADNLNEKIQKSKKTKEWVGKSPENLGKQPKSDKYKNIDRTKLQNLVSVAKLIIEGKMSEKDIDMLDEGSFDDAGYAEAKHHIETNMGANCHDDNCPHHLPMKITPTAKAHRFTDKEHRQHDHIKESEEENGMSEKEADDIAWATVNKQKHEAFLYVLKLANKVLLASSNKPCVTCGFPSDQCKCNSDTNISPGYTQSGTQRKNQAPKVKSNLPPGMDPSKGQQHM